MSASRNDGVYAVTDQNPMAPPPKVDKVNRVMLLRQLANEYEKLARMTRFMERVNLGEAELVIEWDSGCALEGYDDVRKGLASLPWMKANINDLAMRTIGLQRVIVEDLAQRCGITEWQP